MSGVRMVRYAAWGVLLIVLLSAGLVFWQWPDNRSVENVAVNAFGGPDGGNRRAFWSGL